MSGTVSPGPNDPNPPPAAAPSISTAAIDDMQDTLADLKRWPELAGTLQVCAEVIEPAFRRADQKALRHQRWHRLLTMLATSFGTAAVVFAILQLAFADPIRPAMARAEVFVAILASVAVVLGLGMAFQANWLVERNKAERLRLAKFRFLIDPELWSGADAVKSRKRGDLEQHVRELEAIGPGDVHHWVENDQVPHPPQSVLALSSLPHGNKELLEYYRTRRLQFQLRFFRKRADHYLKRHRFTRYLSPLLFFGSVGAVLVHFGYDLVSHDHVIGTERLPAISRGLIVLAASLPVLGGMIRTFAEAYQFARNTYRYRAKAVALTSIDSDLELAIEPRSQFLGLWLSEETLENEHREWLRLMLDAEWFA
jgi:hypothetical protein